ncbi:MAG TPA: cupin domain-containing protein [Gaiellaceae bacterium]
MVPEAPPDETESGLVATREGWFVLNAREARWHQAEGRGARLTFDGETSFPQVGINLYVLAPGEPMGMYHWEADQEDFLVLSGEALLIVEGEERPLRQWDFVHCPPDTKHIIVGAGDSPCAVLAVGAREHQDEAGWGGYTVDEAALRHGAGVDRETTEAEKAYAGLPHRGPTRYREGWLP